MTLASRPENPRPSTSEVMAPPSSCARVYTSATPPRIVTQEPLEGRTWCEQEVVMFMAGGVACRVFAGLFGLRRGSLEMTAVHEAGHAVVGQALGRTVYGLSIEPRRDLKRGKTSFSGGCAWLGMAPQVDGPLVREGAIESDFRQAARYCFVLSGDGQIWSVVREVHRLRRVTDAMVRSLLPEIRVVAGVLVDIREMSSQKFIETMKLAAWRRERGLGIQGTI